MSRHPRPENATGPAETKPFPRSVAPARAAIVSLAQTSAKSAALTARSNATAALVSVECDSVVGAFSDGAFTLLAGEARALSFEARAPFELEELRRGLRVRSPCGIRSRAREEAERCFDVCVPLAHLRTAT